MHIDIKKIINRSRKFKEQSWYNTWKLVEGVKSEIEFIYNFQQMQLIDILKFILIFINLFISLALRESEHQEN